MTFGMSNLTYRQKEITMHLLGNIAILIMFAVYLSLYRGAHNFLPLFLFVSWYLPQVYLLKIHARVTPSLTNAITRSKPKASAMASA
jgi:hypothetical protein